MSICCSSRTVERAKRLAERLERNLEIRTLLVQEDEVPVSETWEEGTGADAELILLDGLTAPPPLRREAWTGLIDHDGEPPMAFARAEDCAYPKLLERRPFFAWDAQFERSVEKWVAGLLPAVAGVEPVALAAPFPSEWWEALVDQPGRAETADADAAHAFAHAARAHFQSVLWIGCAEREPALIRAELDHRLGDGRALAVLAYVNKPVKLPAGRHSYLMIQGELSKVESEAVLGACYGPLFPGWLAKELGADLSPGVLVDARAGLYRLRQKLPATDAQRQLHLEVLNSRFGKWKSDPGPARTLLAEVPAALEHGFAHDWARASELCRRAGYLLLAEGRRREGVRMFHRLLLEAEAHGEADVAADAAHELSWLTDEEAPERPATVSGEQLGLF